MVAIPVAFKVLFALLTAGLLVFVTVFVGQGVHRLRGAAAARRAARTAAAAMLAWLALTGAVAATGFFADFGAVPPRLAFAIGPAFVAVVVLALLRPVRRVVAYAPFTWLIYAQSFRVLLEGLLWGLYEVGVVPVQMTFEGLNFDIVTGLSAPFVAWLVSREDAWARPIAIAWNGVGLGMALTIVTISILSSPVPFRTFTEGPANTFVATVPFVWLPAFVVPLALLFHLWSLGQLIGARQPRIRGVRAAMPAVTTS